MFLPPPRPHWETTISRRPPATYWTNPQFKIHLDEVDDSQEGCVSKPHCTVLLGLMQKNCRRQKSTGQGMLSIGYAVYKVLGAGSPFISHQMSLAGLCWPVIRVYLSYHLNVPPLAPLNATPNGLPKA